MASGSLWGVPAPLEALASALTSARPPLSAHVLAGCLKGALAYAIPATLFRRALPLDTQALRRTAALGLFVGGVRLADRLQSAYSKLEGEGKMKTMEQLKPMRQYMLSIGTCVSALAALAVDGDIHRSEILTIWALIRAIRPLLPTVPYVPVLLACLSTGAIISTYMYAKHEIHPTFRSFVFKQSDKTQAQIDNLAKCCGAPCEVIHPGQACIPHGSTYFAAAFLRGLRISTPLALLSLLAPPHSVYHALLNLVRSATFLATYLTIGWTFACFLSNFIHYQYTRAWLTLGGLAALVERPSRRPELAAYLTTHTIYILVRHLQSKKWISPHPKLYALFLSLSAGMLIHHSEQQPRAVMNFLFNLSSKKSQ